MGSGARMGSVRAGIGSVRAGVGSVRAGTARGGDGLGAERGWGRRWARRAGTGAVHGDGLGAGGRARCAAMGSVRAGAGSAGAAVAARRRARTRPGVRPGRVVGACPGRLVRVCPVTSAGVPWQLVGVCPAGPVPRSAHHPERGATVGPSGVASRSGAGCPSRPVACGQPIRSGAPQSPIASSQPIRSGVPQSARRVWPADPSQSAQPIRRGVLRSVQPGVLPAGAVESAPAGPTPAAPLGGAHRSALARSPCTPRTRPDRCAEHGGCAQAPEAAREQRVHAHQAVRRIGAHVQATAPSTAGARKHWKLRANTETTC